MNSFSKDIIALICVFTKEWRHLFFEILRYPDCYRDRMRKESVEEPGRLIKNDIAPFQKIVSLQTIKNQHENDRSRRL